MPIKRLLATLAASALVATSAAQDYSDNSEGGNTAEQIQTITIDIPERLALHITSNTFELDLDDLEGKGCRLVAKGAEISDYLDLSRSLGPVVESYPAVVLTSDGNVATGSDGEYQKGTLVCRNEFILQKFANTGWELSADVTMTEGSGKLGLRDDALGSDVPDGSSESNYRHIVGGNATGLILAEDDGPTEGWLDDKITQLIWFDGTETPGTKTINVTYVLTGGL